MTQNKKVLMQALLIVIYAIAAWRVWDEGTLRFVYLIFLAFGEVIISLLYLAFNKNNLTKFVKNAELASIIMYLAVAVFGYLWSIGF